MTRRHIALAAAGGVIVVALGWLLFVEAPGRLDRQAAAPASAATAPGDQDGRKIKARLFYVADDGTRLSSVERDVPYAAQPADQAREILNAQIAPIAQPFVSAIPAGTALRAVFITPGGDAFVDLSRDVSSAHPGGSLNEILTVYTIVHALTFNLPAVTAVQVLVDGKEVDTLAGHVDLRRPLHRNVLLTIDN